MLRKIILQIYRNLFHLNRSYKTHFIKKQVIKKGKEKKNGPASPAGSQASPAEPTEGERASCGQPDGFSFLTNIPSLKT
jgi:hypothetical protein